MKTRLYGNFLICIILAASSQVTEAQIENGTAHHTINANDVSFRFSNSGDMVKDGFLKYTHTGDQSFLKSLAFWKGGYDLGDNTKLLRAGNISDGSDLSPGPLSDDGITNEETSRNWDRIFYVTRSDLSEYFDLYKHAQSTNEDLDIANVPDNIKYWPAKGNPYFQEHYNFELPNQDLAQFYDSDRDGNYDPVKGDFPTIRSFVLYPNSMRPDEFPSELAFFINNDNGIQRSLNRNLPSQTEIHTYVFQYDQPCLKNTTYIEHFVINRAESITYKDHLGLYVDGDIGCPKDDYIGKVEDDDLYFFYNSVEVEDSCEEPLNEELPLLLFGKVIFPYAPRVYVRDMNGNIITVEGEVQITDPPASDPLSLDTLIEVPTGSFLPIYDDQVMSDEDYMYLLDGRYLNGRPFTVGGDGFEDAGDTTSIVFDGNPSDPEEWSMCTAGVSDWDANFLMSTEHIVLQPTAINRILYSIDIIDNIELPCPDLEKQLKDRQFYINNWLRFPEIFNMGCTTRNNEVEKKVSIKVYPNPTSDIIQIEGEIENGQYLILDVHGRPMQVGLIKDGSIDISTLPPACYLVKIFASGRSFTEKIVKL